MRRNALLAKPPEAVHRLDAGGARFARYVLGRAPTAADYEGVHTTTDVTVAAAYAMGTWLKRRDPDAYPVILTLDTRGLKALPDIDALVQGYSVMGDMRSELREALEDHGDDVDAIADQFSEWEGAIEAEGAPGDHPSVFVFEHVAGEPVTSFIEALREQGRGDDEVLTALRAWADKGEIDPAALTTIMRQRRYVEDFDLDRVIAIDAAQPWWPETFDAYWDRADADEVKKKAELIETAGYKLWTIDDAWGGLDTGKTKRLYERSGGGTGEYHGTISSAVALAFPGASLIPTESPFPVRDPGELEQNGSWSRVPDGAKWSVEGYDWIPSPQRIASLFDTRVTKVLGCGGGGCAVSTARRTAIKITSDASEIAFIDAVHAMREAGQSLEGIVTFDERRNLENGVWAYERPLLSFGEHSNDEYLNQAANIAVGLLQDVRFNGKRLTAALFDRAATKYRRAIRGASREHQAAAVAVVEMLDAGYMLADVVAGNIAIDRDGRHVLYDAQLIAVRPDKE
jgi:hypothetical protein